MKTLYWQDHTVFLLDQRALPLAERYVTCTDYREVIAAINDLTVRGAPAIGVAAAMGIALGALHLPDSSPDAFRRAFDEICTQFAATRPTARNLFWAIERMKRRFEEAYDAGRGATMLSVKARDGGRLGTSGSDSALVELLRTHGTAKPSSGSGISFVDIFTKHVGGEGVPAERDTAGSLRLIREALIAEAIRIGEEDIAINRRLGRNGRELIPDGARILTHCNAGALATAGYGTALGVIRAAREEGKNLHVYVDETRPVLQGARLTAWELLREGVPCTLIADNMAGFLMQRGGVDLVMVGADRIAANGDTANKIGTYGLAVLAGAHGIPFYVAAPLSTIDPALPDGGTIPIEERNPDEVTHCGGVRTAPEGVAVWNPAFDVTPNSLIAAIVTEAGVFRPPFTDVIKKAFPPPAIP
ncbi:MAG: S-methyl-5-thioribose-1-phosphate isomerase [Deltaproteobacteria bacterium]|nr:S-methyl-5-thioribose-1-phosphate isomerase [Deltaproteobacteria bacterium]